jgi:hypothetical protein
MAASRCGRQALGAQRKAFRLLYSSSALVRSMGPASAQAQHARPEPGPGSRQRLQLHRAQEVLPVHAGGRRDHLRRRAQQVAHRARRVRRVLRLDLLQAELVVDLRHTARSRRRAPPGCRHSRLCRQRRASACTRCRPGACMRRRRPVSGVRTARPAACRSVAGGRPGGRPRVARTAPSTPDAVHSAWSMAAGLHGMFRSPCIRPGTTHERAGAAQLVHAPAMPQAVLLFRGARA